MYWKWVQTAPPRTVAECSALMSVISELLFTTLAKKATCVLNHYAPWRAGQPLPKPFARPRGSMCWCWYRGDTRSRLTLVSQCSAEFQ